MWVAAIDFKKAFDSQHAAIWRCLRNHSVSEQYICVLKNCPLICAPPYRRSDLGGGRQMKNLKELAGHPRDRRTLKEGWRAGWAKSVPLRDQV